MFADKINRHSLSRATVIHLIIKNNGSFLDFFISIIFPNLIIIHLEIFLLKIRRFTLLEKSFLTFMIILLLSSIQMLPTPLHSLSNYFESCREFIIMYNIRVHVQYTCTYLICIKYCILDKLSKIIRVKHNDYE